jgi:signal transduction histidine kinase
MFGQLRTTDADVAYREDPADRSTWPRAELMRLDRAVTSDQVARAVVEGGMSSTQATSGALVLLTEDRHEVRVVYAVGDIAEPAVAERRLPLNDNFPLVEVVRTRKELWLAHSEELTEHYSRAAAHQDAGSWAVLPLMIDRVILGAVGWSFRERWFSSEQRARLRRLAEAGGVALYRAGLFDAERRARLDADDARVRVARRDMLMAEVSATLDSDTEGSHAFSSLARVARLSLGALGRWCAIYVLDEHGFLRQAAAAHADPGIDQLLRDLDRRHASSRHKLPVSLNDGKPVVLESLADNYARQIGLGVWQMRVLRSVGLSRLLVEPLRIHGHTLGTLCVASDDTSAGYSHDALALADRIARRCAASLEYMRLHDAAERANQAREDFVAATSHELRTPLSHIKGFVSTLRTTDTQWDTETRDDFLAEIEQEADRLARLVETLLDMSRIDSGGLDPSAWAESLPSALVEAGLDRLGTSLGEHPLEIQLPGDLPAVWVDASQVERVIANLVDNAAKYSPPTEPISLNGRVSGDFVSLRVEDRGLGIPAEHLERIFEPFFREPTGAYPSKPGAGLGLAICRSIVRSQNGRIWAEQRAGGGASFVFTLPIAQAKSKDMMHANDDSRS